MTYLTLTQELEKLGASSPSLEAAELIRFYYGKSREWCLMNPREALPDAVTDALSKRALGVPLQYILGEAWFYGYRFKVTPDCLIPQPDTEHTVALALSYAGESSELLDLCTGSGCIPIAVLNENSTVSATAVDISAPALNIARENAAAHKVSDRISFIEADVLNDSIDALIRDADIITSNPPYINTDVIPTLSVEVRHEPVIALDGGADGMIFYRHFILNLAKYMKNSAVMLLEIGYDQSERITELCRSAELSCKLHRDFGGNIRVAEIRKISH